MEEFSNKPCQCEFHELAPLQSLRNRICKVYHSLTDCKGRQRVVRIEYGSWFSPNKTLVMKIQIMVHLSVQIINMYTLNNH